MGNIFDGITPIGDAIDESIRNGTARSVNTGPYNPVIVTDEQLKAYGLDSETLDKILKNLAISLATRESRTLPESDFTPPLPRSE
jgi:hypothetical protein